MNEFTWLHGCIGITDIHVQPLFHDSSNAWDSRYSKSDAVRRIPLDTIGSWCIKNTKNRFSISTVAFLSVSRSWQDEKYIFLHFFTELKTYNL